jgi:hypothetical protein
MTVAPKVAEVRWERAHRIISTIHPPVDLFEDIADPEDWDSIMAGETITNSRALENVGQLALVPAGRRVGGPGASYVMAPFTHVNPAWAGRFHDGRQGAYYAANRFETAVAETMFHRANIYRATGEEPGWFSQYRELVGCLDAALHDLRNREHFAPELDPDSYSTSQALGRVLRLQGSDGVVYPSVRDTEGTCVAAFWPNVVSIPVQGRTLAYHFDGERIDFIRDESNGDVFRVV